MTRRKVLPGRRSQSSIGCYGGVGGIRVVLRAGAVLVVLAGALTVHPAPFDVLMAPSKVEGLAQPAAAPAESAQWKFDWNVRTDQDGKPAGHYEVTPYPITETTESYTITNDEGTKTYHLGTKYYVDGGTVGVEGDGSWEKPWKTIKEGMKKVPAGNNTLVIRGAHDGFNGEYDEVYMVMKTGVDDTHRFMVVGYGQERPVVKGSSAPPYPESTFKWPYGQPTTCTTLQRVKIQDNLGSGIRSCEDDSSINIIDVWLSNNCKWDFKAGKTYADGNLYFLGSDYCTIRHCTSERPQNHAYKIGDGADYPVVEWSVAKETGWWKNYPIPERKLGHPTAFDFPNDSPKNVSRNVKLRYCIADTGMAYGIQLRTQTHGGHDIKYCEITGFPHVNEVPAQKDRTFRGDQVVIYTAGETDFHNNIVRDAGNDDACGVYVIACESGPIRITNNLIYGNYVGVDIVNTSARVQVRNNSIYSNNNAPVVNYSVDNIYRDHGKLGLDLSVAERFEVVNNILYQAGKGPCTKIQGPGRHSCNRYYFPQGERGCDLTEGESDGDPGWAKLPEGPYNPMACLLKDALPGTNLSKLFTVDFHGTPRSGWDMGAREHHQE